MLCRRFPAELGTPAAARRELRRWLARRSWPTDQAEELLLAVDEAITNAVEHAYPYGLARPGVGLQVDERTEPTARRAVIIVRDRGRWRQPPADPGHRGRGLAMIRALTESLTITPTPAGTEVRMISRPVAPAAG